MVVLQGVGKMTDDDKISVIFNHVRQNGELTNKAQSDWGMDRWEWKGIAAGLCDAGYTEAIIWGDRLSVYHTYGHDIVWRKGTPEDLDILFQGIA
jgi:hypothetical protein